MKKNKKKNPQKKNQKNKPQKKPEEQTTEKKTEEKKKTQEEKAKTQDKKEEEPLDKEMQKYKERLTTHLRRDILGEPFSMDFLYERLDDKTHKIDFLRAATMKKMKNKNEPKDKLQEKMLKLNREKQRMNEIYAESLQITKGINKERKEQMKKRFLELFGKYNKNMYPEGFRHFENLVAYKALYPERSTLDYQKERILEFYLFFSLFNL